jgi:hypothetical protein
MVAGKEDHNANKGSAASSNIEHITMYSLVHKRGGQQVTQARHCSRYHYPHDGDIEVAH